MANVIILGGGFGGVVAAERLAQLLPTEHQITLISRHAHFVFYPALVRLAFGVGQPSDIVFDLREAMPNRRVRFIRAEVARVNPHTRRITFKPGDGYELSGEMPYDYLIFALGRRLATEQVTGFYEHAHHVLSIEAARRFADALKGFRHGHAVIGACRGARLPVPVYETAFALARHLAREGCREAARISIVMPDATSDLAPDAATNQQLNQTLLPMLETHGIAYQSNFDIARITAHRLESTTGMKLDYDLLMLIPPFRGSSAINHTDVIDDEGYIRTAAGMKVMGVERLYAVGDCVAWQGAKLGHLAVKQAEVAAENLAAEIGNRPPRAVYHHEIRVVIEAEGHEAIYLHHDADADGASIKQNRFWNWAKRVHQANWMRRHS